MNSDKHNVNLPENLQRQFASLKRRLWRVETARSLSIAGIALLASYLVLFLADRVWDSPIWFRTLLLVLGIGITLLAGLQWAWTWVLKPRHWRELSILVQRRFRTLGDRLLGIVELSSETKHSQNYSPELYEAAIRQVADDASRYDFGEAVETRGAKRCAGAAVGLLALLLIPAVVVPAASWNAFTRWSLPFANIERYTLVQIAELPARLVVPHGEAFTVNAKVSYRSFWKPGRVSAQFTDAVTSEGKVQNGQATLQVPGQVQNGNLKVRIGDAEQTVAIEPSHRPALKELSYKIQMPDYLKYPAIEEKARGSSITLLENSHISFVGNTTRDLLSASVNDGKQVTALEVKSNAFSSAFFNADLSKSLSFQWQDTIGLSNATPWRVQLVKEKDRAPLPDMPELSRELAILHTDVLDIRTVGKDDYGIRELGVSWEVDVAAEESAGWASTEVKINKNSTREKEVEEVFRWSPAIFRVPPDTSVELVAFSTDYFPGRERSQSTVRRINVLGNERHAELIRQNLESVLARVEDVSRKQEQIMAKADEAQNAENLTPKASEEKLGKIASEQAQNSKQLEQLSKEGMQALREGLKNPVFTPKVLQDWSKTLQQMQQLSSGKMSEAGKDLKSAQEKSGNPEEGKKELAKAQKKIEEILEELEKLQGDVNKNLDDLQALTMSERLRKLGDTEEQISTEMKKIIPETIGLLPKELPEKFRKQSGKLVRGQDGVHQEAQKLHKEINRFYERTQKPTYGEVGKEMTDKHLADELDNARQLLEGNIGMEATRNLTVWSKRFAEWADKLQPPTEESESGQGQGQGKGDAPNMTKTLVALLRLREKEMTLHRQTGVLEEQKSAVPDFKERAGELLAVQRKIKEGIVEIEIENKLSMLAQPYRQTREKMTEVENFLQVPRTDTETTGSQVQTVELLSDVINLINEQAKRNPPPSQGGSQESEEMAFLMQMASQPGMGQGMGTQSGGGNMSGGTTDRAATGSANNDASGRNGEERAVKKATGASSMNVPTEFRETLESYFKALEQEQSR